MNLRALPFAALVWLGAIPDAFAQALEADMNPGDRDGDFVADGRDNCPDVPNRDQADPDGDGVGEGCPACVPGLERCNRLDDDCDGRVDETCG